MIDIASSQWDDAGRDVVAEHGKRSAEDAARYVAELKKNGFVGEIAILCDVPRTATIKAREQLATLRISKDMFYRLIAEFPQMAIEIMRELAHRLEDTNEKLRNATRAA